MGWGKSNFTRCTKPTPTAGEPENQKLSHGSQAEEGKRIIFGEKKNDPLREREQSLRHKEGNVRAAKGQAASEKKTKDMKKKEKNRTWYRGVTQKKGLQGEDRACRGVDEGGRQPDRKRTI